MSALDERPRLLIVAGPNGSGKTTVTERGLAHEWFGGCEYINPDIIARDEFGDWNSDTSVRRAADVALFGSVGASRSRLSSPALIRLISFVPRSGTAISCASSSSVRRVPQ
jgi:predicted ABC-type ATPase